jgi:hypothetical protein
MSVQQRGSTKPGADQGLHKTQGESVRELDLRCGRCNLPMPDEEAVVDLETGEVICAACDDEPVGSVAKLAAAIKEVSDGR